MPKIRMDFSIMAVTMKNHRKLRTLCLIAFVATLAGALVFAQTPHRVNKAIELLAAGQPVYYTGSHEGTAGGFEAGKKAAQTWADYIMYDMEHAPFDVTALAEFMRGLAAGGPTKSGHRTPAVVITLPFDGSSEAVARANAWMLKQVLATGIHGVMLCHAQSPAAVKAFVESARMPTSRLGVGEGLGEGKRGVHGVPTAAKIWGISTKDYIERADTWPLNPKGELMLGLKIEDKHALEHVDESLSIPGIAFAEWGPGDMALSYGITDTGRNPMPAQLQ